MTTTHCGVAVDIDCRPVYYRAYLVDLDEFRAGYEAAMQRDDSDEVPDDLTPSEADGWRALLEEEASAIEGAEPLRARFRSALADLVGGAS